LVANVASGNRDVDRCIEYAHDPLIALTSGSTDPSVRYLQDPGFLILLISTLHLIGLCPAPC
jgi:hypothetical protein